MTPGAYSPSSGIINHPNLGPCRYELTQVSDDPDTQVAQVIGMMADYATADANHELVRRASYDAWHSDDALADIFRNLARYEGGRMRFVSDEAAAEPVGRVTPIAHWNPIVETLIRPADQCALPNPQGDCDDFSMLGASMLLARGVPCSFVTVAADPSDPSIYSHVYLAAYPTSGPYQGKRVPLDLSHGSALGWETESRFGKRREWPVRSRVSQLLLFGAVGLGVYLLCSRKRRTN